jgi:glycosyltransferase involved in cell wall biosynthesis/SAM-dependent methyltransferase
MRIALLTTQCPFVLGGAELHARNLERALREAGHEAEIVSMPFKWYPAASVLDHMLAARALDVSEFNGVKIDLAIGLKFPAYLMRHPMKAYWILHQHRQAYDLWDSGLSDLYDDPDGQSVREAVMAADDAELRGAPRMFANSANVAARLQRYNGVTATPLYHPPPLAGRLTGGEFGSYFYYPSRLSPTKRQDLVLRALAVADRRVRVVFSGAADSPDHERGLKALAHELGVEDRVEWRGFVSEAEMIDLYAGARGVLFTPIDEDLGYIALEAMLAGKPLVTVADAGEPAALARDGVEGLITAPEPEAFAAALDVLAASESRARTLGAAGRERYRSLGISWPHAVAALTGQAAAGAAPVPTRAAPSVVGAWLAGDGEGPTLARLAERYAFDEHLAVHRDYYETHWPRYQATLDVLKRAGVRPRRILELGTSAPYVFTAFLREAFPDAEFTVVQESPPGLRWRSQVVARTGAPIEVEVLGLNVETTSLPFPDGAFDLVVAMEILEHFAIDPGFVFREARRVLRDGGVFLVTTPNLVSLPGVWRALTGETPYSFGLFVPWNGVYGRHNREYTPLEVDRLGAYAGFERGLLETADVYRQDAPPEALVRYMAENRLPLELRGQNIFYAGRKRAGAAFGPPPSSLFPIDPAIFSGRIELVPAEAGEERTAVRVVNLGPLVWPAAGPARVRLSVDVVDQDGMVTQDARSLDLPHDVGPGGDAVIPLWIARGGGLGGRWWEIGLYAEGAGPFAGAGRARPACVFAETLEAAPAADADAA